MVIQCTQCQTRFKIADDKLKPGGIKVRCSKCRHIFTVMPPEPVPSPPAVVPTPPESADEEGFDFGDFNMKPVAEEQTGTGSESAEQGVTEQEPVAGPGETGEEEASSGFSLEEDATGKGPIAFEEEESEREKPVEFDFEEKGSEESGSADFDFEEEEAPQQEAMEFDFEDEGPEEKIPTEFDFEEEDAGAPGAFSFEEEEPFPEEETDASWDEETAAGPPEDFDFGEETGGAAEVEDFDLSGMSFGDEGSMPTSPGDAGDFGNIPLDREQEEEPASFAPPQPPELPRPAASGTKKVPAASPVLPRRKSPLKGLMTFILLLLLALCAAAGYFFWQRGELNVEQIIEQLTGQGAPTPVAGQIRLTELSSAFVTNRQAGQMFVIRGQAVNDYPDTRSAIAVKGILYDKAGKALLQQTVFCGNSLDTSDLRNLPFAKIEESMNNQFGDSLSNLNVGPGKSIPFTIVFKNLPSDMSEFTVETVDSKPGSKP